ncbi:hypothetical protein [Marinibacterium profundimaris]|uniref:hypothetical protein n=1 Tax=Marinibacterium profundimaris TaxID=1679460 RepID=UPI00117C43F7|nr:hypothetical protein [Marinibacterium profundimaris]
MYIRLPVLLKGSNSIPFTSAFHDDSHIIESLDSLGCRVPARLGPDGSRLSEYTTEKVQPGKTVKTGTILHLRDLAAKNAEKVFDSRSLKEINKYGIYFGTLPTYEANFYVARTSDESLTIFISQRDVAKLHACSQHLIQRLLELPICDITRTLQQRADIYSSSEKSIVGTGKVKKRSLATLYLQSKIDFKVFGSSVVLLLLFGILSHIPNNTSSQLLNSIFGWSTEIWKACLGATIGSGLAIMGNFLTMEKSFFDFDPGI